MNKSDLLIAIVLIVLITVLISFCADYAVDRKQYFDGKYDAELILPGNTVVTGQCTGFTMVSLNWSKVRVNGKWYNCNPDRIVLKERDYE